MKNRFDITNAINRILTMQPDKKDALVRLSHAKGEFPKILVIGNQDSMFLPGLFQNVQVFRAPHDLGSVQDVVAVFAKRFGKRGAGRFVDHEFKFHAGLGRNVEGKDILVRENFCGIGEGSPDIERLQIGIFF